MATRATKPRRSRKVASASEEPAVAGSGGIDSRTDSSEGGSRSDAGAKLDTTYHSYEQQVLPVDVALLSGFKHSTTEEFAQFAVAQFFVAGAFWLAIERAFTTSKFWTDPLFLICVAITVMAAVVAWAGFRQLRRRQAQIDRIIRAAGLNPDDY